MSENDSNQQDPSFDDLWRLALFLDGFRDSQQLDSRLKGVIDRFVDNIDKFYNRERENFHESEGRYFGELFELDAESRGRSTAVFAFHQEAQDYFLHLAFHYAPGNEHSDRLRYLRKYIEVLKGGDRYSLEKALLPRKQKTIDWDLSLEWLVDHEFDFVTPVRHLIQAAIAGEQKRVVANRRKSEKGEPRQRRTFDIADAKRLRDRITKEKYRRFCRDEPGFKEVLESWPDLVVDIDRS